MANGSEFKLVFGDICFFLTVSLNFCVGFRLQKEGKDLKKNILVYMSSVNNGDKLIGGVRRMDGFYYFVIVENSEDICR